MPRMIADRPILKMTSELGRVMAAARLREQSGGRVYHLERGEPDFDTPPHIVEALAAAARAGETHYPDQRGGLAALLFLHFLHGCHVRQPRWRQPLPNHRGARHAQRRQLQLRVRERHRRRPCNCQRRQRIADLRALGWPRHRACIRHVPLQ